jgi:hypothetical protein
MASEIFDFRRSPQGGGFSPNTSSIGGAQGAPASTTGEYAMMPFNLVWRRELRSGRFADSRRRVCELRRNSRIRRSVVKPQMSRTAVRLFQFLLLKWLELRLFLAKNWLKIGGV